MVEEARRTDYGGDLYHTGVRYYRNYEVKDPNIPTNGAVLKDAIFEEKKIKTLILGKHSFLSSHGYSNPIRQSLTFLSRHMSIVN